MVHIKKFFKKKKECSGCCMGNKVWNRKTVQKFTAEVQVTGIHRGLNEDYGQEAGECG